MRSFEQHPEQGEGALRPHYYLDFIKISWFVLICFLLLTIFLSNKYIRSARASHKGEDSYSFGKYEDAKENYAVALNYTPNSEKAKIGMAMACFATKDTTDDEEGLHYLDDLTLDDGDWGKLSTVMPEKYKAYFETTMQ